MLNILLLHPSYYYCKGLSDSLKSVNIRIQFATCAGDAQKLAKQAPDVVISTVQTLLFLPQINQNLAWEKTQIILIGELQNAGFEGRIGYNFTLPENAKPAAFLAAISEVSQLPPRKFIRLKDCKGKFSVREQQIADLLLAGYRCNDIGEIIGINGKTVSTYKHRIFKKLSIKSMVDLRDAMARRNASQD